MFSMGFLFFGGVIICDIVIGMKFETGYTRFTDSQDAAGQ